MKRILTRALFAAILLLCGMPSEAQPISLNCGYVFSDPGGSSGNYPDNADVTYLACPSDPSDGVIVTFSSFITETGDKLLVYNGPAITSPLLGVYSGNLSSSLPGGVNGLKATGISGCLSFRFTSNDSLNNAGWLANVSCAVQCKPVTGLSVHTITANTAQIQWILPTVGASPASFMYEVRTSGGGGSGVTGLISSGTVSATTNTVNVSGLTGNTVYNVFVRTNCGGTVTSPWVGSVSFMTLPQCGSTFTDPGGPLLNYAVNLDTAYVICPTTPGSVAKVNFVTFETQAGFDKLSVYNGNAITAPLIGEYSGIGLPNAPGGGEVMATNPGGCLTFRFVSNATIVYPGWLANVTCAAPPACLAPAGLSADSLTATSAVIRWLAPSSFVPLFYEYEVRESGLPGSGATGLAAAGSATAGTFIAALTGLANNTVYYVYLRSNCGPGNYSDWSVQPLMLVTPPVCGSIFTDPNGAALNYPDNADVLYKICPDNPGDGVVVTFSAFNMGSGDKLAAYNGSSITAPLIANYAGNLTTNLPGGLAGIKSTDTSGCLTFRFTSNATLNGPGWVANVSCAPHCLPVAGLAVNNITHNSVSLNWTNPATGSVSESYVYEIRSSGNPGSGATGLIVSGTEAAPATTLLVGGLSGNTLYKAYLRHNCGGTDTSQWRGPVSFTTLPGCGSTFTDPGGPLLNYGINLDSTNVICPTTPGDVVKMNFVTFETQLNFDKLLVYDGNSAAAPLIGTYSGIGVTNAPGGGEVIANNPGGCLTFQFLSNATTTYPGWLANVSCIPAPACLGPSGISASNITTATATLQWVAPLFSFPVNYEYEVRSNGLPGSGPAGLGASGSVSSASLSALISGLSSNTSYLVYMRSECSAGGYSVWSVQPLLLVTPPVCGQVFTDPGGSAANHPDNADVTYRICPDVPGAGVVVTFSAFNMGSGDKLAAYNGSSITAPLIANYAGNLTTNLPGGLAGIKSTDTSGCLTFRFTSNASLNAPGWVANVSCVPHCMPVSGINISGISSNSASLNWLSPVVGSVPADFVYEIRSSGNPGSGISGLVTSGIITAPASTTLIVGLEGNTSYKAYVRSNCGGTDTSQWRGPVSFTTLPGCGSTFTDPGGPLLNYGINLDTTYVICPSTPGDVVKVNFVTFETQLNFDKLLVYNGNSAAAPLIGTYSGIGLANAPGAGEIIANNPGGCLTFQFLSNATTTYPGWLANVSCVPAPVCVGPSGLSFSNLTTTGAMLQWVAPLFSTPESYEYEVRVSGLPGSGSAGLTASGSVPASTYTASLSGLSNNTVYYVYMRSNCGTGSYSVWSSQPLMLVTPPVCGSVFTDPGGAAGNYPDNADITYKVCPENPGDGVKVTFSAFNMASGDRLAVYNGSSITSPLIGNFTGNLTTNLPGGAAGLKSTDTSGCLVFRLFSNATISNTGWVANVTCAPHCKPATNLAVSSITASSAQLSWSGPALGSAPAAYIFEVRLSGNPGSGAAGLVSTDMVNVPATAANITSLSGNTLYKIYVRTFCGAGDTSQWWAPISFTTLPGCGSTFTDPGGPLFYYGNNLDSTTVICPNTPGEVVKVNFVTFETQLNFDKLLVYNGSSVSAPLIGTYSGSGLLNAPGAGEVIATNTSGCLAFKFISNASVTYSGWLANVSCVPPPTCVGPSGIYVSDLSATGAVLHWLPPMTTVPMSYEYEVRSSGLPGSGLYGLAANGTVGATTFHATLTGLAANTVYQVYMRSNCDSADYSMWSALPLMVVTPPVCGSIFTDPGGAAGNYPDNANVTYVVCPESPSDTVFVTFSAFNLASGDLLSVYNGNTITAPLLGNFSGNLALSLPGGVNGFMSNNVSGCLTFKFTSNASLNTAGWQAAVNCHTIIPCAGTPSAGIATASGPFIYCGSAPAKALNLTGYTNGVPGISIVWQVSEDNISYLDIPGAVLPAFTTPAATATRYYRAKVTCGASGMSDYSNPILIEVPAPVSVVSPPVSINVCPGHAGSLSVVAANAVSYQWYLDGTAITGATAATYVMPAASVADAGNYYVRLSGEPPCPNMNSGYATVTVNPVSAAISYGTEAYCGNAGMAVVTHSGAAGGIYAAAEGLVIDSVSGAIDLASSLPGTFAVTYTIPAGLYCDTFQTSALVTILNAPVISVQPSPVATCISDSFALSVIAAGVSSYQWYRDGILIPAATGAIYSLTDAALSDAGIYHVLLDGCTESNAVPVSVVSTVAVDLGPDVLLCAGETLLLNAGNPGAIFGWSTGALTQTILVNTPGTYVVTASIGSCWDTDILNVADGSLVHIDSIYVLNDMPHFTFNGMGISGASGIDWSFGDGATASGDEVSHSYTASGAYMVTCMVTNDCGVSDTATVMVAVSGLQVPQPPAAEGVVAVYPNPASGRVTVTAGSELIYDLELMDYTGRMVLRAQAQGSKSVFSVQGLTPGFYLLRLNTQNGIRTAKLEVIK